MSPQTLLELDIISKVKWFTKLGQPDSADPNDDAPANWTMVVNSWDEAIDISESIDKENLWLEAANQFREKIVAVSKVKGVSPSFEIICFLFN